MQYLVLIAKKSSGTRRSDMRRVVFDGTLGAALRLSPMRRRNRNHRDKETSM